jgi:hypothetical protein
MYAWHNDSESFALFFCIDVNSLTQFCPVLLWTEVEKSSELKFQIYSKLFWLFYGWTNAHNKNRIFPVILKIEDVLQSVF